MKLSPAEKLILTMLADIQLALKADFTIDSLAVRDAIAYNQLWVLDFLNDSDEKYEQTPDVVIETSRILEMWSNIESSIKNMNESERRKLIRDVGIENCRFGGFYPNRSEHHTISLFLIRRLRRFSDFSDRKMSSSDSFSIDRYRNMIRTLDKNKFIFPLNGEDLKSVLLCNNSNNSSLVSNRIPASVNSSKIPALSEVEWTLIASMLPRKSRGVARIDDRLVFDAVLWRFRSGRSWRSLPDQFGSFKTAYNRLKRWKNSGLWRRIVTAIHRLHGPDLVLIDEDGNRTTVKDSDQILDCHVAWEVPLIAENARRTKPSRHAEVRKTQKSRDDQPQRTIEAYESSIDLCGGIPPDSATLEIGSSAEKVEDIEHMDPNKADISINQPFQRTQHQELDSIQTDFEQNITIISGS